MAYNLDDGTAQTRVLGHGYTLWLFNNRPIFYATNVSHTSPQPLAQAVEIQPLNYVRPLEIVTGRAITGGRITITVAQTFGNGPMDHLFDFRKPMSDDTRFNDLADVLHFFRRWKTEFSNARDHDSLVKVMRRPQGGVDAEKFFGIRIIDIREDEEVGVDTLAGQFSIEFGYTHKAKIGHPNNRSEEDYPSSPIKSQIY